MNNLASCLLLVAGLAQGAVIAEAREGPVTVELHDQTGYCQSGALLAVWIEGESKVTGCWTMVGQAVHIAWADANFSRAPVAVFKQIKTAL